MKRIKPAGKKVIFMFTAGRDAAPSWGMDYYKSPSGWILKTRSFALFDVHFGAVWGFSIDIPFIAAIGFLVAKKDKSFILRKTPKADYFHLN